jgi:Tol biopolymer transport system component
VRRAAFPLFVAALAGLWACGALFGFDDVQYASGDAGDAGAGEAQSRDSSPVEAGPPCQLDAAFGVPAPIPGLATYQAFGPRLSADELTIYLQTEKGFQVATRATRADPFGPLGVMPGPVNLGAIPGNPSLSGDGLTLAFTAARDGGAGSLDLYEATRQTSNDVFINVTQLPVSTAGPDDEPCLSLDGNELWFSATPDGVPPQHLYHSAKDRDGGTFQPGVLMDELVSSTGESMASVSGDGLTIYFGALSNGRWEIWKATRASRSDRFGKPEVVQELQSTSEQHAPGWLSPDGCRLYFSACCDDSLPVLMYVASKPQ